jgi:hypothetical protein
MSFLFGDSSPSTLQIDYIDFLRDALDFSVQVLAADERMQAGAARVSEVRRQAEAEVTRLEALGATQARAIDGVDVGEGESATAQCAQALLRGAAELVRAATDGVRAAAEGDAGRIDEEARRDRRRCVDALATFLKRHDLPEMSSELRLQQQAGNVYAARLYVRALGDLQAVLELEIPASNVLAHVARVDKLMERLEVHAPEAGGWLRKEVKLRPQRLEKELITAFVSGRGENEIQLRGSADGSGVGYDLVMRDDSTRVILRRAGEATDLPPFDLDDTDSARVIELKDKLRAATADLMRGRQSLVEAAVGEIPLGEHRDPKVLVERLVALMTPVVQEIARRSLTPTELVLKRQTDAGRREEIFVSRRDLQLKLRSLSPASRARFSPLGLGELPAEDFIEPEAQASAAPAASVAPPTATSRAIERSIFGKATAATDAAVTVPPPAPRPEPSVRLDDSLDRLIISEATIRKPE